MKSFLPKILIRAIVLIALTVAVASAQRGIGVKDKSGKDVILYENSHALIIGNSTYKDGSWGNLPGVSSDVDAVSDILCRHGFQVEVAENLTSKNFEARIKKFINDHGKRPNNRILIYYAGHGYRQKSAGDNRHIGYVVPTDAPSPKRFEFVNFAVSMDTIENYAKDIQSKHALFVFDNCFSGKLVSRAPVIVPDSIVASVGGPVRQFMTSGNSEQEVPDESGFRRAFVRGLEGEADENRDSYTTASELAVFIKAALYGTNQSPQYGKISDPNLNIGDFTFAKPTGGGGCATKAQPVEPPNDRPAAAVEKANIVESDFFTFRLIQCKSSGTMVSCDLTITNRDGVDKNLGFEWNSNGRIFDENGAKSDMSDWVIAEKSGTSAVLLPNIPVRATLRFKTASPPGRFLPRIDLAFVTHFSEGGYYKTRDFVVKFQNVALQ